MSGPSIGARGETCVHPTAMVDSQAELGDGVVVGPWALIGPRVQVGGGTNVGPRVLIERDTLVGEDCLIANGAVLGTDPQDLKYKGEESSLEVGDRTVIREFATLNRTIGSHCIEQENLLRGVRKVPYTTDNVGDSHTNVVHNNTEVVGHTAVSSANYEIIYVICRKRYRSEYFILYSNFGLVPGNGKSDGVWLSCYQASISLS